LIFSVIGQPLFLLDVQLVKSIAAITSIADTKNIFFIILLLKLKKTIIAPINYCKYNLPAVNGEI